MSRRFQWDWKLGLLASIVLLVDLWLVTLQWHCPRYKVCLTADDRTDARCHMYSQSCTLLILSSCCLRSQRFFSADTTIQLGRLADVLIPSVLYDHSIVSTGDPLFQNNPCTWLSPPPCRQPSFIVIAVWISLTAWKRCLYPCSKVPTDTRWHCRAQRSTLDHLSRAVHYKSPVAMPCATVVPSEPICSVQTVGALWTRLFAEAKTMLCRVSNYTNRFTSLHTLFFVRRFT